MLEALKKSVCEANKALPKYSLVVMHSGNVSGYDPNSGLVVIKPSGVDYDALTPDDLAVVNLDGQQVQGPMKPSVDTPVHLYLYRHRPQFRGIVHTHSNYATSFAALGKSIPAYLTAIADEFGNEIPCAPYATNRDTVIADAILSVMNDSPACLLKNHGVFTFDVSVQKALKAAVMVEDVAKTVHLALQKGMPDVIPPEEVKVWWDRYHGWYGQSQ
jgi:L-ribulose-5-phosphate 4-epimerase